MSRVDDDVSGSCLTQIAVQLGLWKGDRAEAIRLRELVGNIGPRERPTDPDDVAARAALAFRDVLAGRISADDVFGRAPLRKLLVPLLGAEPEGSASYHLAVGGHTLAWAVISLSCTVLALGTLALGAAWRTVGDPTRDPPWWRRAWNAVWAVRSVFAIAVLVALSWSAIVLLSLQGTDAVPAEHDSRGWVLLQLWLLWGALSLFLGMFLGLILQGRSFYDRAARGHGDGPP